MLAQGPLGWHHSCFRLYASRIDAGRALKQGDLYGDGDGDEEVNELTRSSSQKLLGLSSSQFIDMCTDILDEMIRCEKVLNPTYKGPVFASLASQPGFVTERNRSRRRLAALPYLRWELLVRNIVFELDRRYPVSSSAADVVQQLEVDSQDSRESSDVVQSVDDETPADQSAGVDHIELEKTYHCKGCEEVSCLSLFGLEASC
jgi:hypothetical protein